MITKLAAAVMLLVLGGAAGAALTARPVPARVSTASPVAPPVEVRTRVERRTIHVYRRPKHIRPAVTAPPPAPAPAPVPVPVPPVVAAPIRAAAPAPPVQHAAPIVTRTSGAKGGGEHEHEHEGGDD